MENKNKDFRNLEIWQEAHKLALEIYNISKLFPKDEIYGLTSQIRRAAVSVALNIAEGYGRYHYLEEINFLFNARGSITEVQSCLLLSKDLKYVKAEIIDKLFDRYSILSKRVNSLIKYKKEKKNEKK